MLADLISSKTRIKLLLKFFLNSNTRSYLRGLSTEFDESTNAVRLELNRLEGAGLLASHQKGNKKFYQANTKHPLYKELHQIVRKHLGIDQLVLNVVERLGSIDQAYLTGAFADGKDSNIIDIILIGDIDEPYLTQLIPKAEKLISRRIRYIHYAVDKWAVAERASFGDNLLLIWDRESQLV